ncbi:hypothetical protein ACFPN0_18020 [Kitasatospora cinereorecta]
MVTLSAPYAQDRVALAEIELCGELMIAASAATEDRLSRDRIDEVLDVRADRELRGSACTGADRDMRDMREMPGVRSRRDVPDTAADRDGRGERAPRIPRQCHHRG